MRILIQIVVILTVLLAFGASKFGFEDQLSKDMVEAKLIQPPLDKDTSLELGQTGAAVALGGLRSLVAAAWNLRAFLHFEELEWLKLEQSYKTITSLQPQTTHYWETGAWHLHSNASAYYNENTDLPAFRRRSLRKLYIQKGSNLLEEGVRQNPDNWRLHLALASVWNDRHKLPDYPTSVQHYENALACDSLPNYRRSQVQRFTFYTMCNIPERYSDALALGSALFHETEQNHLPSLVCSIFALQNELDIPVIARIPDDQLFPNKEKQLSWLKNYLKRQLRDTPISGVKEQIDWLEQAPSF